MDFSQFNFYVILKCSIYTFLTTFQKKKYIITFLTKRIIFRTHQLNVIIKLKAAYHMETFRSKWNCHKKVQLRKHFCNYTITSRCTYIWCARTIRECVNIYALLYASDIKMTIYEQTITWSIFNIFSAVERVLEASTAQKPKQCSSPQTLVVIVWFVCSLAQQPNGTDSFFAFNTFHLRSHIACVRTQTHT